MQLLVFVNNNNIFKTKKLKAWFIW